MISVDDATKDVLDEVYL